MAKLSTIEDVEQREQNPEPAQDAPSPTTGQAATTPATPTPAPKPTIEERLAADADMTAKQEEEFHGLDSQQPMSVGHKSLIIVATVVLVVAILYIVNSWIHFV